MFHGWITVTPTPSMSTVPFSSHNGSFLQAYGLPMAWGLAPSVQPLYVGLGHGPTIGPSQQAMPYMTFQEQRKQLS